MSTALSACIMRATTLSKKHSNIIRIGFIALTDCAPLLVAESLGLFIKYGIHVNLTREIGWATIREKIYYHQLDAAHALAGLGLSLKMGFGGRQCNAINPFVFNVHGNAITLGKDSWRRGTRDAATLHKLIRSTSQKVFTFGIVERSSSHHFLLRRWLKSGGIDPDKDVRLVVLPPTQMAECLRIGLVDGYCAGEPWNSQAVAEGIGWCPAVSADIMPLHPEKVLLTTEEFAQEQPENLIALMRALYESCAFCDRPENRSAVASVLHKSGHFLVERSVLQRSLCAPFDTGYDMTYSAETFHIFHRQDANEPTAKKAAWLVNEFLIHGLISQDMKVEASRAATACWDPELFQQACLTTPIIKKTETKKSTLKKITLKPALI